MFRWNAVREYFGFKRMSIEDLDVPEERKRGFSIMYGDEDLDLVVGMALEPHAQGMRSISSVIVMPSSDQMGVF